MKLRILSGGAAFGLVDGLRTQFENETSATIDGTFGAVGTMKEKLLDGTSCDLLILSRKLMDELSSDGRVDASLMRDIGTVSTGVAFRSATQSGPVTTQDQLRRALRAATQIMVPDMARSTAGIHMKSVFEQLGVLEDIAGNIREYPNGATAMKALAESGDDSSMGCTQVTEILYTPGVQLAGKLPPGAELDTVYTAGVAIHAQQPELARRLLDMLSDSTHDGLKKSAGFQV